MSHLQAQPREGDRSALLMLTLSSILWGGSFVSVKIGLDYVNPYDFAFLRLATSAVILLAVFGTQRKFESTTFKEPSVWLLGVLNGLGFTLQFVGLLYTTAAKTALLVDMNVVVIAILSWRLFGESFGPRKQLGVVLGVLGAVMITTNGDLSILTQGQLVGDVLVFIAGLVWAVFIVLHKRFQASRTRNVIEMSATVQSITALSLLPMALIFGGLDIRSVSVPGWEWVAISAVVCTVLPYALWVSALRAVTATIAAVFGMLEVVSAMVLSTLLLGEHYTDVTLLGAALVLTSILAVAET